MTPNRLNYILFFVSAAFLLNGCGLFGSEKVPDESGTIFGRWELKEIRYDNGETLKPAEDEPYWFELSEDSVWAEGASHPSLIGQSNCNPCFGYFDYDEETREIKIAFICERLICGIATEFATIVATSYKYSFRDGELLLYFDSVSLNRGKVTLVPKK